MDFQSILPRNSTELELQCEQTLTKKFNDLNPEIINAILDPWKCPEEFLPWLAYMRSVDVWNHKWPEAQKRAVIANSFIMHKHKGTRGGLQDALDSLGIDLEIIEWFQKDGMERGTMQIVLNLHQNLNDNQIMFDQAIIDSIISAINSNKRFSIHFDFVVNLDSKFNVTNSAMSIQTNTLNKVKLANTTAEAQPSHNINIGVGDMSAQFLKHTRYNAISNRRSMLAGDAKVGIGYSAGKFSNFTRISAKSFSFKPQVNDLSVSLNGCSSQINNYLKLHTTNSNYTVNSCNIKYGIATTSKTGNLTRFNINFVIDIEPKCIALHNVFDAQINSITKLNFYSESFHINSDFVLKTYSAASIEKVTYIRLQNKAHAQMQSTLSIRNKLAATANMINMQRISATI